jgi:hypothetical protein
MNPNMNHNEQKPNLRQFKAYLVALEREWDNGQWRKVYQRKLRRPLLLRRKD